MCLCARVFNLLKLIYKRNKPVTNILVGPITGLSFKTLLMTTREFQAYDVYVILKYKMYSIWIDFQCYIKHKYLELGIYLNVIFRRLGCQRIFLMTKDNFFRLLEI